MGADITRQVGAPAGPADGEDRESQRAERRDRAPSHRTDADDGDRLTRHRPDEVARVQRIDDSRQHRCIVKRHGDRELGQFARLDQRVFLAAHLTIDFAESWVQAAVGIAGRAIHALPAMG